MLAAAFAATFAGGMAYFAWQKPSHAAQAQSAGQNCTLRADGTCEPQRRGFVYYFYPRWGSSSSASAAPAPRPQAQTAALSSNSRASVPAASSGTTRGGFGSTGASTSHRVSAGG